MPQQRLREATTTWMAPERQRGEETEHRPPGGAGPAASGASRGLPAPQRRAECKAGRGRRFMTEADGATGGSACCSAGGYHAGNEVTLEQTPKPDKVRLTPARQAGCADGNTQHQLTHRLASAWQQNRALRAPQTRQTRESKSDRFWQERCCCSSPSTVKTLLCMKRPTPTREKPAATQGRRAARTPSLQPKHPAKSLSVENSVQRPKVQV